METKGTERLTSLLSRYGFENETTAAGWLAHGLSDGLRLSKAQRPAHRALGLSVAGEYADDYERGFNAGVMLAGGE